MKLASPSDESRAAGATVLLTGACGFTAEYVRSELDAAGYIVRGSTQSLENRPGDVHLDVTDRVNCRAVLEEVKPDYVIHLAAISFVQHADDSAFYQVNTIGTVNLLQSMLDLKMTPKRVVLASSANVYGNSTAGCLDEAQAPAPVNHYAASKLAMEHMARTFSDRLPIVIARPFNYTGVGQSERFLVPKIVSHFARRAPRIELGNLDVERDFSDVRVIARAYRTLLERECDGATVNLCSGHAVSLREILRMSEALSEHTLQVEVNPLFVRSTDVKVLMGSPSRLHQIAGDDSLRAIPLVDTLQWMMASMRSSDANANADATGGH